MTTAAEIIQTCASASAVTLYGGYAVMPDGSRKLFEPAHIASEKRNASGRCTFLTAEYKDGSALRFTWSPSQGARYTLIKATQP